MVRANVEPVHGERAGAERDGSARTAGVRAGCCAGRGPAGAGGQYELTINFANNDKNGSIPQAVASPLPVSSVLATTAKELAAKKPAPKAGGSPAPKRN